MNPIFIKSLLISLLIIICIVLVVTFVTTPKKGEIGIVVREPISDEARELAIKLVRSSLGLAKAQAIIGRGIHDLFIRHGSDTILFSEHLGPIRYQDMITADLAVLVKNDVVEFKFSANLSSIFQGIKDSILSNNGSLIVVDYFEVPSIENVNNFLVGLTYRNQSSRVLQAPAGAERDIRHLISSFLVKSMLDFNNDCMNTICPQMLPSNEEHLLNLRNTLLAIRPTGFVGACREKNDRTGCITRLRQNLKNIELESPGIDPSLIDFAHFLLELSALYHVILRNGSTDELSETLDLLRKKYNQLLAAEFMSEYIETKEYLSNLLENFHLSELHIEPSFLSNLPKYFEGRNLLRKGKKEPALKLFKEIQTNSPKWFRSFVDGYVAYTSFNPSSLSVQENLLLIDRLANSEIKPNYIKFSYAGLLLLELVEHHDLHFSRADRHKIGKRGREYWSQAAMSPKRFGSLAARAQFARFLIATGHENDSLVEVKKIQSLVQKEPISSELRMVYFSLAMIYSSIGNFEKSKEYIANLAEVSSDGICLVEVHPGFGRMRAKLGFDFTTFLSSLKNGKANC